MYTCAGLQKVGTAGTAGAGQTTFGWTKWKNMADVLWQERRNLVLLWHEYWTHCPMSIGHIVQWLLDTLSNDYWTDCPLTIGHIVQWWLETLFIDYWTHCPTIIRHIVQWLLDTLSNDYWKHCQITIGQIVQSISVWPCKCLFSKYLPQ